MNALKAFQVSDDYEGHTVVIFAASGVAARREGANELGIEFSEVGRCARAPHYDRFAPGPVPVLDLLADGWQFEVDGQLLTIDDKPWISRSGEVWRSPWHWLNDAEERANRRRVERETTEAILAKFPFATDITPGHVYHSRDENGWGAYFTFPGGQDPVKWIVGADHVLVTPRDLDAWLAIHPEPPL